MTRMVIKSGSSDVNKVKKIQQALVDHGNLELTEVDGLFGSITKAAVIKFQNENNLSADGIVGQLTAAALGIPEIVAPITSLQNLTGYTPPTNSIFNQAQRQRIAEKLDALIPAGPVDLIDGPMIAWLVDLADEAIAKVTPPHWLAWLHDLNAGLANGDLIAKNRLIENINIHFNIPIISEKSENTIISFLVDILIESLTRGGNLDYAFKNVAIKNYQD